MKVSSWGMDRWVYEWMAHLHSQPIYTPIALICKCSGLVSELGRSRLWRTARP